MAVYFDTRLAMPHGSSHSHVAWHPCYNVVAVGSCVGSQGQVNVFDEEGERVSEVPSLTRALMPNCISWHPMKQLVATGWEKGEVTIISVTDKEHFSAPMLHANEITCLSWSHNGGRLVSGDTAGLIVTWRVDSRGRIQNSPVAKNDIKEWVKQILAPPPPRDPFMDISSLARAAVSGDESALDMFNWKKTPGNSRASGAGPAGKGQPGPSGLPGQDGGNFFVAGDKGGVYFLNDGGISSLFSTDGPVGHLLHDKHRNILLTITDQLMLYRHNVATEGQASEISKVKLSGKSQNVRVCWAGGGRNLVAMTTGEQMVRLWDFDNNENYVLNFEGQTGYEATECLTCLTFFSISGKDHTGELACGTNLGKVAIWKFYPSKDRNRFNTDSDFEPASQWHLQPPATVGGVVMAVESSSGPKNLLVANTVNEIVVLHERHMQCHFKDGVGLVQTSPTMISVDFFATGFHLDMKTDIQIKGLFAAKTALAIWNGHRVVVYELAADSQSLRSAGSFSCETDAVAVYDQTVLTVENGARKIQVRTLQGTVKQALTFAEAEGEPVCLDVNGHFLTVATENAFVKLFDMSRREVKQHGATKSLRGAIDGIESVTVARANATGTHVSLIARKDGDLPDSCLYCWDMDSDAIRYFDFATGYPDSEEFLASNSPNGSNAEAEAEMSDVERGRAQTAREVAGRHPVAFFWDANEPKMLCVEITVTHKWNLNSAFQPVGYSSLRPSLSRNFSSMSLNDAHDAPSSLVATLFATAESGLMLQSSVPIDVDLIQSTIGLQVPYLYFLRRPDAQIPSPDAPSSSISPRPEIPGPIGNRMCLRQLMKDFVGLEEADDKSKEAMINFSLNLVVGNMDEAFKAIKLIKSESVWENMARMCVKTRRLDVAAVCLGHMGHARGAKALRDASQEPEIDARVAALALQLGMSDDAERLYRNCGRFDLLNQFYQASGQWQKALETAESQDRINLRTTYYNYAKHLESMGDVTSAIAAYEKSDTHRFEVPRMLLEESQALETYIVKTKDKELRKWWAQYMESTGDMNMALQFYEAAHDFLSLVRIYCYCENMEKAAEIANDTGDLAASYHLARQFEAKGQMKDAIHFFTRAQAYGNAIRLCKENGMEDQLLNLALLGKPHDMIDAARFYENSSGMQDKAVMLYHKAGLVNKALELAFRTEQFGPLQLIADDLDSGSDPELVAKCAAFFLEHGHFDKAVDLLAISKKYLEAIELCHRHNVILTEELCEKLTPGKPANDAESEDRNNVLERLAEVCAMQRQFHLATKKFTQAGNRPQAMKALLKSGDTEKIIFFAGVSRQREIYIMAANYLQSLNWRQDPEIMKNIIGFYTKGKALHLLAGFYDACSQVEIDEYQNYEKALGALSEAVKCMAKSSGDSEDRGRHEQRVAELKMKMGLMKKFVQARRAYDDDEEEGIRQCEALLEELDLDGVAVRPGDVYAFIIEHYARKQLYKRAYQLIEQMREKIPKVNLSYYLDPKTLGAVHKGLGIEAPASGRRSGATTGGGSDDVSEEVEEEVDEDIFRDSYA